MKSLFVCATLLFIFAACSKHENNAAINSTDNYFIQQASYSNYAEINAGTIAASKGNYDSVKMFGSMMIGDHSKAETALSSLALNTDENIPTAPDPVHQAKAQYLKSLSGHTFDTAYINAQVKDHKATINLFQMELSSGHNQLIKNYANQYLPVIQMHLQEALMIKSVIE